MEVNPKKYYGQHFLKSPASAERIADAIPGTAAYVLEIGPGKGILTGYLYQRFGNALKIVEIDRESIDYLKETFNYIGENNLIEGDFLKQDLTGLFQGEFHLVGNFPYNISSQIIFRLLENRGIIPSMTGMFQEEVALRIASGPGSKVYGILSVLVQAFYSVQILFTLSENAFTPPPRVKSAVIRLIRKNNYRLGCDDRLFFRVVKQAFQQRRKTLRNSLKTMTGARELPGIFVSRRPEELSVDEFIRLTQAIEHLNHSVS
ncbi:MAG: 16S rRNA (adenine(1518)-N(6)/adenine(1519)-N(6))-dimethyltransferase RsmA [Bacteroidales bacterium]